AACAPAPRPERLAVLGVPSGAAIVTTEAGYALAVGPGDVDVIRFEQLVAEGRRLAADGEMARWRRRQRPWARRSACGGESRWLSSPTPASLRPNGRIWTSWLWWRSRTAPERTWCWAATGRSPASWRPHAGGTH